MSYFTKEGFELLKQEYNSIDEEYKKTTRAMGVSDSLVI